MREVSCSCHLIRFVGCYCSLMGYHYLFQICNCFFLLLALSKHKTRSRFGSYCLSFQTFLARNSYTVNNVLIRIYKVPYYYENGVVQNTYTFKIYNGFDFFVAVIFIKLQGKTNQIKLIFFLNSALIFFFNPLFVIFNISCRPVSHVRTKIKYTKHPVIYNIVSYCFFCITTRFKKN